MQINVFAGLYRVEYLAELYSMKFGVWRCYGRLVPEQDRNPEANSHHVVGILLRFSRAMLKRI